MKLGRKAEYLSSLWRPSRDDERDSVRWALNHNEAPFGKWRKYPDLDPLYKEAAKSYGVREDNILLTYGAEQGIRHVFGVFVEKDDVVLRPEPTFGMLQVFEYYSQARVVALRYSSHLKIDVKDFLNAIAEHKPRLIYIASPDNPTGSVIEYADMHWIAEEASKHGSILLIDSVYNSRVSYFDLAKTKDNVIIVTSLSKWAGLAGLRVGFVISNAGNIDLLRKLKPMDEMHSAAVKPAVRALRNGKKRDSRISKYVVKWQNKFFDVALNSEFEMLNDGGNFILLRVKNQKDVVERLLAKSIKVTSYKEFPLKNCIKFSIGPNRVMRRILRTVRKA